VKINHYACGTATAFLCALCLPAFTWAGDFSGTAYDLTMEYGYPVLTDYSLAGTTLHPLIDTGAQFAVLPPQVYQALQPQQETDTAAVGISTVQSNITTGLVQMPLLGSDRQRWVYAAPMEPSEEPDADSILPLDFLDADFAAFLLSCGKLLLFDDGPGITDVSADEAAGDADLHSIPLYFTSAGIFFSIACEGQYYLAQLDTGSDGTLVSANFASAHPAVFKATGETSDWEAADGVFTSSVYDTGSGLSLMGAEPKDDVALEGEFYSNPARDFEGQETAAGILGDPSSTPFSRADTPAALAPVMIVGMDILGQYDFMLSRAYNTLYLWPPADTRKYFDVPEKEAQATSGKQ
jgi:hypothetical protein